MDLTVEEGQRLKVIFGSHTGFHVIDVDSGNSYDIYIPSHVSTWAVLLPEGHGTPVRFGQAPGAHKWGPGMGVTFPTSVLTSGGLRAVTYFMFISPGCFCPCAGAVKFKVAMSHKKENQSIMAGAIMELSVEFSCWVI